MFKVHPRAGFLFVLVSTSKLLIAVHIRYLVVYALSGKSSDRWSKIPRGLKSCRCIKNNLVWIKASVVMDLHHNASFWYSGSDKKVRIL